MVCAAVILMTIAGVVWAGKFAPHLLVDLKRSHLALILAVELLGLGVYVYDGYVFRRNALLDSIPRPAAGAEGSSSKLTYRVEDEGKQEKEKEIDVELSPRKPTEEEAREAIRQAKREIDESVLGANPSATEVYRKLHFADAYCDGQVEAVWNTDDTEVVDTSGTLHLTRVKADLPVIATCTLRCGDVKSDYDIALTVIPPPADTVYGFRFYLRQAIRQADRRQSTEETVTLPREVSGERIIWCGKRDLRGMELTGLGVLIGVAIILGSREEARRQEKRRREALDRDYPELVSALCLYVSAGVGVKAAFYRIAAREFADGKGSDAHPGYGAVRRLCRRMDDGMGELEAYRSFGRDVGHKDYNKLAMLLAQNLKKGSRRLVEKLEKEEAAAFEQRKLRARVAGEEASTKLLIPMGMLLAVVLAVMVLPSIVNLKI